MKSNILFIMVDQLTAFITGAYGHKDVITPNLDRLAAEGVRFDAAYSPCAVCGPARACLMSGKQVSNVEAWDNAAPMSCDEVTIPHYLTNAGYDTVLSGKMHFAGADQLHGFNRRLTTDIYPAEFSWTWPRSKEGPHQSRGIAPQYTAEHVKVAQWSNLLSYDEETHFRAKEYLHAVGVHNNQVDHKEEIKPFFLCVSYHHPHEPFYAPQELWDLYENCDIDLPELPDNIEDHYSTLDKWLNVFHGDHPDLTNPESIRKLRRAYYALVTYIDIKVGELLDSLEENGLSENTVVVFTSDHGDMLCERGMIQKRSFYEWSSRVPLIFRFPDGRAGGTIVNEPVSLIDLMPTFNDLAGVERTAPMDGHSLMPLIDGNKEPKRGIFVEYHSEGCHGACFMYREGRYKYVYLHGYESQLFDLEVDPSEWNNLSENPQYAEVVERMKGRILETFDPDDIDLRVQASVERRELIREAMNTNATRWDHFPQFDATLKILDQYRKYE